MELRFAVCAYITHLAVVMVMVPICLSKTRILVWSVLETRSWSAATVGRVAVANRHSSAVDAVCVGKWLGRAGNNICTLAWAIHAAVEMDVSLIRVPARGKHNKFSSVFDVARIPRTWRFGHNANEQQTGTLHCAARCNRWGACIYANGTSVTSEELRGPPSHLLHHYVTEAGLLRCNELTDFERPGSDVLTMHMRSGDILNDTKREMARNAPCAFWKSAFQSSGCRSALIVTEPHRRHPCIRVMLESFPGRVVVQSSSLLNDFCTLLKSQNLAVSASTFAIVAVTLSTTIRTIFAASWYVDWFRMRNSFVENCFNASCPGYPMEWSSPSQKMESMLNYSSESVSIRSVNCTTFGSL